MTSSSERSEDVAAIFGLISLSQINSTERRSVIWRTSRDNSKCSAMLISAALAFLLRSSQSFEVAKVALRPLYSFHIRRKRALMSTGSLERTSPFAALFGEINHSVCRRQDRLRGTIILIKRNDFRSGAELTGEVENISHRRSAERINRLRVISNHSEAPTVRL